MKDLSEYVFDFASDMEEQLEANQDKGGWEGCTAKYLLREMHKSMKSAEAGIFNGASTGYVTKKLANAANYAMMLADNYTREHRDNDDRSECDHSTYVDVADADNGIDDWENQNQSEDDCNA